MMYCESAHHLAPSPLRAGPTTAAVIQQARMQYTKSTKTAAAEMGRRNLNELRPGLPEVRNSCWRTGKAGSVFSVEFIVQISSKADRRARAESAAGPDGRRRLQRAL